MLQLAQAAAWLADQGVIPKNGLSETAWRPPVKWEETIEPDGRRKLALDALIVDADAALPG